MFKQYRLIPHEVAAVRLTRENVHRLALFCGGLPVEEVGSLDKRVKLELPFKGKTVRAVEGDYIVVHGNKGPVEVLKQQEFLGKYEAITPMRSVN